MERPPPNAETLMAEIAERLKSERQERIEQENVPARATSSKTRSKSFAAETDGQIVEPIKINFSK